MQNEQSQQIVLRFYRALDRLAADGAIRGVSAFARIYGFNKWNFATQRREPWRDMFQLSWLELLARDFGVSPSWLLSGHGRFYAPGWDAERVKRHLKVQQQCTNFAAKSQLSENKIIAKAL